MQTTYIYTRRSREADNREFENTIRIGVVILFVLLAGSLLFAASRADKSDRITEQQRPAPPSHPVVAMTIDDAAKLEFESDAEKEIIYDEISVKLEAEIERSAASRDGRFYFPDELHDNTYEVFYREDIPLDTELQHAVFDACVRYDLDPLLVYAVIWKESTFRNVSTPGDGTGYMQIMQKWHSDRMARLGVTDLTDGPGNILVGCDYLWENVSRYGLERGLGAYNSGSPAFNDYTRSVIAKYNYLWDKEYGK